MGSSEWAAAFDAGCGVGSVLGRRGALWGRLASARCVFPFGAFSVLSAFAICFAIACCGASSAKSGGADALGASVCPPQASCEAGLILPFSHLILLFLTYFIEFLPFTGSFADFLRMFIFRILLFDRDGGSLGLRFGYVGFCACMMRLVVLSRMHRDLPC